MLGHDDRDEVGLAARQAPHLFEQRLYAPFVRRQDLEPRLLGEIEPPRPDPGVRVATRPVERPDAVRRRDLARVPERAFGRDVDRVDGEKHFVRRPTGGDHSAHAGAKSAREAAVVAVDAEEARDEERHGHGHEPRALGELRPDDDEGHDAGCRRTDGVDDDLVSPTGSRVRSQYRTIPACDSVNAVKTPIT